MESTIDPEAPARSGPSWDGLGRQCSRAAPAEVDWAQARSYSAPSDCAPKAEEHGLRDRGSVTAREFSFLALGLILGLVAGAALIELFRARPPAPHEVRLTV